MLEYSYTFDSICSLNCARSLHQISILTLTFLLSRKLDQCMNQNLRGTRYYLFEHRNYYSNNCDNCWKTTCTGHKQTSPPSTQCKYISLYLHDWFIFIQKIVLFIFDLCIKCAANKFSFLLICIDYVGITIWLIITHCFFSYVILYKYL